MLQVDGLIEISLYVADMGESDTSRAKRHEQPTTHGVEVESEIHCGCDSSYVRAPDGHLFELTTSGCWSIH